MDYQKLVDEAFEASKNAYVPYSHFRVGACLLLKNGQRIYGTNIENAAYGSTMCAERNAIFQAYCQGYRQDDIEALAIVADTELPVSPCGACRQVISELFPHDKKIYLANLKGDIKETTVDELLPYSFDSEDL